MPPHNEATVRRYYMQLKKMFRQQENDYLLSGISSELTPDDELEGKDIRLIVTFFLKLFKMVIFRNEEISEILQISSPTLANKFDYQAMRRNVDKAMETSKKRCKKSYELFFTVLMNKYLAMDSDLDGYEDYLEYLIAEKTCRINELVNLNGTISIGIQEVLVDFYERRNYASAVRETITVEHKRRRKWIEDKAKESWERKKDVMHESNLKENAILAIVNNIVYEEKEVIQELCLRAKAEEGRQVISSICDWWIKYCSKIGL